jgi:hypothetical protein
MIFSISFGYKSIRDSIDSAKSISLEISKTEENRFKMIERLNDFSLLEDELLSKSLKNLNISEELDIYSSYKDSFDLSVTIPADITTKQLNVDYTGGDIV